MGERILIVDDDIADLMDVHENSPTGYMWYYIQELNECGYDVVKARGPDESLTILSSHSPFKAIILDVMMPPGNAFRSVETLDGILTGVKLAERIREDDRNVPIILLTNVEPTQAIADLLRRSIVQAYCYKPDTTPGELVQRLRDLCR